MIQGSDEWRQARLGKLGASMVAEALAKTKTGWGAGRKNTMAQLLSERLTGVLTETFVSAAMEHGTNTESEARSAYEFYHGVTVDQVGFVDHGQIAMTGASPDGLVGDKGLVEIKCPNTATHIDTLLGRSVPGKYVTQMLWQMACTGRQWCDFASYDPRMPEHLRLFVKRVHRDDKIIKKLEDDVLEFLLELEAKHDALARISPADQAKASVILEDAE